MAGASLLALIDDIASILDDVTVMTKVAAQKDRRRSRRRPRAERPAGVRRARRARVAGGLGGGRRIAQEQVDPGAGGTGDQRA